jgi:DNA-binding NarL/FixJ family response regulator
MASRDSDSDIETSAPHAPIGVLVVEDEPESRAYLSDAIRADRSLQLVDAVATLADGARVLAETVTDVLLVDLGLPDGNGTELIRFARELGADTQCMVVTVFGDESSVVKAIQAGARGYLLKDDRASDIGRAVHQLVDGGSPLSPSIARQLLQRFAEPAAPQPARGERLPKLSERETQILRYVVKGFTFPEIGELMGISAHTVTTYARRIYRKLEVRSRSEAVFEALSRGWTED